MRKIWQKSTAWIKENSLLLGVLCGIFLFDHITKVAAFFYLPNRPVELLPFFHLTYVENTGASFGMMRNGNFLLIFVMLAIVAYIIISWRELCSYGKWVKWGSVFILAGAVGNLYDRIMLGFVVDFLDFRIWPVFNVADSFITIGGCMFVISLLMQRGKKREEK